MKTNSDISISLVVPCYNEAKRIEKGLMDEIIEYSNADSRISEVIVVDDGSNDNSYEVIKKNYLGKSKKLKLIAAPHQGKAYTLITGIKAASAEYVLLSDIDLATPLQEIDKLTDEVKHGFKIIIGSRKTNRVGAPILRRFMSAGYIYIRSLFINLHVTDTQCGFKLYDRNSALEVIKNLKVFNRKKNTTGRVVAASFDLEFLYVATRLGYTIKEVPVAWKHVDTENFHDYILDGLRTLKDIFLIKYYDLTGKYTA